MFVVGYGVVYLEFAGRDGRRETVMDEVRGWMGSQWGIERAGPSIAKAKEARVEGEGQAQKG